MDPSKSPSSRIESLDQFRGYTVAGMLLVNFIGGFQVTPAVLKHHNTYCSYADTIMPQFFFAVGFAYRLTFLRRCATLGAWKASAAVLRRALALILIPDSSFTTWTAASRGWETVEGGLGFMGFSHRRSTASFSRRSFTLR